jgi:twitching motility protein PilI
MNQPEQPLFVNEITTKAAWLSPSAALAHFEPPEGVHQTVSDPVSEVSRARYGFRIGELGLLINPDTGNEVLAVPQITPLPGTPLGFLGLINLRGNLVPLYELHVLLGMGMPRYSNDRVVLIFGQGEKAVGILIDNYPKALPSLRALPNFPPLPDALQPHVSAGYLEDDAVWLEFNHSSFFDENCRNIGLSTIGS